ncbi:FKBP-type peptidyl-prolyl cis-trans isomerase [Microscilla marina]|uniref:Peptidyl-prolyl cis-trans isomerase n=1 Tax=Microscilla marina ATCC 23134 TaxID=313606 RepID=A1ZPM2_MICM2|nr:FKBP-type peptidyl-prolyl cis-trans isomerase [Microscilla marina]EAY27761.1 -binding protein 9, putative [Microscilla marina ATCC 23134]
MRQSILLVVIACASILITSCKTFEDETEDVKQLRENEQAILNYLSTNNLTAEQTDQGLYYVVTKANPAGQAATLGSKAVMHYVGSLLSGTVVDSTSPYFNEPTEFIFDGNPDGTKVLTGIELGVVRLKEGEQATLFIPYNLAYGRSSRGNIPPYSVVKYDISSFDIKTEREQMLEFAATDSLTYIERDSLFTANIIKAPDDNVTLPKAGIDSNVTVAYTGRFLDGTIFDTNESLTFDLKAKDSEDNRVLNGWTIAVNGMRVGDKKVVLLYSNLAYGAAGNIDNDGNFTIPPYSILWFEIELKSVN